MLVGKESKNEKKQRRKSIFITLMLSYVLILLLPIILGVVFYGRVESIMQDNVNRSNMAMLEQLKQIIDSRLKEVDQLAEQIAMNPRLYKLLNQDATSNNDRVYPYIELMNDLKRNKSISGFIYDFYIYFPFNDIILTPSMKITADMFFNNIYRYADLSYNEWKNNILSDYHYKLYLPPMEIKEGNDIKYMITYIQSLPFNEKNYIRGVLVVLIDQQQIIEMLKKVEWANQGDMYITDQQNQVVMTTAAKKDLLEEIKNKLVANSGIFEYTLNGENMMVSYTSSQRNGWKYISVMSKDRFMAPVEKVRAWTLWLLLIYLALGGLTAYMLAYRNYSPIREVIYTICKGRSAIPVKITDEMGFIKETVTVALAEKRELQNKLFQQLPIIRSDFISHLVKGYMTERDVILRSMESLNIYFISDIFVVLLMSIDDCICFAKDNFEYEWTLIRSTITDISERLIGQQCKVYLAVLDRDRIAVLLNMGKDDRLHIVKRAEKLAYMLKDTMKEQLNISTVIAISDIHEGIQGISKAYQEAMEALDYSIINGKKTVIMYNEIKNAEWYYYYPIEIEMQFMNLAQAGNFEALEKLLDDVFDINFEQHNITVELGRCLFFNMISTLIKVLNTINANREDIFTNGIDPLQQLMCCDTVEKMHENLKRVYMDICLYIKANRSDRCNRLLDDIINYIDGHYSDNMLGLINIAQKFSITPQYLSTFFKKYKGQNIADYITSVRIKNAKKLLLDKSLSISQIAQMVGYANDVGFIRVFKKYEGVTPGRYRINSQIFNSDKVR